MKTQSTPFYRQPFCLALLLVIIGLLLYLPALPNHFVWDDEEQVVQNEAVHSLAHLPELLSGSTFNSGGATQLGGLYYKPLMSVSFAVVYSLAGPAPWAFHLLQIGLHLGSGLLVYGILRRLWRQNWLAWLAALIWLVHPQNVETVVYISSLQDTLYLFFGLVGLGWIVRTTAAGKSPSWTDLGLAGSCVFLAILGKETGGLFGILIGLYWWSYGDRRQIWRWGAVFLAVLGVYFYLRVGVAHVLLAKNVFTPMATLPFWTRLANIPEIVGHYLSQWIWPSQLAISQHWAKTTPEWKDWVALVGLGVGWLGVWAWSFRPSKIWSAGSESAPAKTFRFFWVWFALALGFHLQLLPLDMTVADRWFYLPMIGLIGAIGSLVTSWQIQPRHLKIFLNIGVCVAAALCLRSSTRIRNWHDGLTLYRHDSQIMRDSFDLENNLGVELYRSGDTTQAASHFQRSTELAPQWWTNWNNLGAMRERAGELDQAALDYQTAIHNGGYYLAYGNYANVLLKQGKVTEARDFLQQSLLIYPHNQQLLQLNGAVNSYLADPFRESRPFKPFQ